MTGRRAGFCAGNEQPGWRTAPAYGRGGGRARWGGRGYGRLGGRGYEFAPHRRRWYADAPEHAERRAEPWMGLQADLEAELREIEARADYLRRELEIANARTNPQEGADVETGNRD